jgi:tRNA threonylcarbamoyladenosine biosynthesis protein TsaE
VVPEIPPNDARDTPKTFHQPSLTTQHSPLTTHPSPLTTQHSPLTSLNFELPDPAATTALGHRLGRLLFPGSVVALTGPLGAGKTYLVRAIAEGLEIADSRAVSSPTFVLIQEYSARLPIYHFDAYRLQSETEFFDLGAHEYFAGSGVCLIEWADRVPGCLPAEYLRIELTVTGETSRLATLQPAGIRYQELVGAITVSPIVN